LFTFANFAPNPLWKLQRRYSNIGFLFPTLAAVANVAPKGIRRSGWFAEAKG